MYGTLMKGFGNDYLLENSVFLGKGHTSKKYSMHIISGLPFVHDDESLYPIQGEVYEVSEEVMNEIDDLEDNGSWYTRYITEITLENGKCVECWMFFNNERGALLQDGNYKNR